VKRRADRDAIHPGTTRTVSFDCRTCAACCRDNEVILEDADLERLRDAGRMDLVKYPLARKRNGKLVLTLLRSKDCRHLGAKNVCRIYDVRPNACRDFPMGSECCLYAREEELSEYDGVAP
jgi:Fe-S-cluster containining protein